MCRRRFLYRKSRLLYDHTGFSGYPKLIGVLQFLFRSLAGVSARSHFTGQRFIVLCKNVSPNSQTLKISPRWDKIIQYIQNIDIYGRYSIAIKPSKCESKRFESYLCLILTFFCGIERFGGQKCIKTSIDLSQAENVWSSTFLRYPSEYPPV